MHVKTTLATIIVSIGFAVPGSIFAQEADGPECGTFVVYLDVNSSHLADHGEDGVSPGDQRVIHSYLLNDDGNRLGESHAVTTYMPPMDDGTHPGHVNLHHSFANGSIASVAVARPRNPTSEIRLLPHDLSRPVVGGTGEFAHVTGTITSTTLDDGRRQLTYDLICHG